MTLTVILDLVVAGLLATTIAYAVLLTRRLGALRDDKAQLEALVKSLDQSARRAEAGVAALNAAAAEVGRELQQRVDQGRTLRTDLSYIIDLGGNLADRLEGGIRSGRGDAKAAEPAASAGPADSPPPRRPAGAAATETALVADRREPQFGSDAVDKARVTGFPSRAERLLRRALEARS
jgi:hypothetical protein